MKVLLTGAVSFLGSHLSQRLIDGNHPVIAAYSSPQLTSRLVKELQGRGHLFDSRLMAKPVLESYRGALAQSGRQF
jgi:nucleoside-diphosphate-sugar epimerase